MPPLDSALKSHGKLYWGVATDQKHLSNPTHATLIPSTFGQLTPENSLKWASLQSTRGHFTFSGADYLVSFAEKHNLLIRGHTLLWHRDLPLWVERITDPDELTLVIKEHVTAVVGRYAWKIYAWDVCNEVFNDEGGMRGSHFFKVLGESFVRIAFEAARNADGKAKLYVNDYFDPRAKVLGACDFVRKWKAEGVEIDGIGVQGHVSKGEAGRLGWCLEMFSGVVEEVAITELDIVEAGEKEYVEAVKACLANEKCVGITSWGVRDEDSWRAGVKPLLFDGEWRPKPACHAVMKALEPKKGLRRFF